MSSNVISPLDDREVVRCDSCNLVQYRIASSLLCRRCHTSIPLEEKSNAPAKDVATSATEPATFAAKLSQVLRERRITLGLTQRALEARIGIGRFYISRFENCSITPSLLMLERSAQGLNTRASSLIALIEDPGIQPLPPFTTIDKTMIAYVGSTLRKIRQEVFGEPMSKFLRAIGMSESYTSRVETGGHCPHMPFFERFALVVHRKTSEVIAEIEHAAFPNG